MDYALWGREKKKKKNLTVFVTTTYVAPKLVVFPIFSIKIQKLGNCTSRTIVRVARKQSFVA